jgi:hypothetical protein
LQNTKKETLPDVLAKSFSREKEITSKMLWIAHKVAKENQYCHNFEAESDLQELNGIDTGRILHYANAVL